MCKLVAIISGAVEERMGFLLHRHIDLRIGSPLRQIRQCGSDDALYVLGRHLAGEEHVAPMMDPFLNVSGEGPASFRVV